MISKVIKIKSTVVSGKIVNDRVGDHVEVVDGGRERGGDVKVPVGGSVSYRESFQRDCRQTVHLLLEVMMVNLPREVRNINTPVGLPRDI
jgi:hypothetical protein